MKADRIIKNAKVFTSDKNNPMATSIVVKDGKFAYVGDEAGLANYEGEVTDLGGKFILPGLIDSHVHITTGVGFEYLDLGVPVMCSTKKECLAFRHLVQLLNRKNNYAHLVNILLYILIYQLYIFY